MGYNKITSYHYVDIIGFKEEDLLTADITVMHRRRES